MFKEMFYNALQRYDIVVSSFFLFTVSVAPSRLSLSSGPQTKNMILKKQHLNVKKGYLQKTLVKGINRPKPVVSKGFLFDHTSSFTQVSPLIWHAQQSQRNLHL